MSHDTFHAYDDAGNRYTVHVRSTFIDTRAADGRRHRVEGLRSYHLNDGGAVDRLDEDHYRIADSGVALRRRARVAAQGSNVPNTTRERSS